MASDPRTVTFIVDQLAAAGNVSARAMFGEYGLYCGGVMVAMVCDDRLFVKPTAGGRALAEGIGEAPPYPGAKPCILVKPDRWDDAEWLSKLIRTTADELPPPRPRHRRSSAASG